MERALTAQAHGAAHKRGSVRYKLLELNYRLLTTLEGLYDSRILSDSSAFGRESGLPGTKPVLNFFFSPLLSLPITSILHLTLWPHQANCNIFELLTTCPFLICFIS